jgi:two-component sensor histidine kinase
MAVEVGARFNAARVGDECFEVWRTVGRGRVAIRWSAAFVEGKPAISWQEDGGPPVRPPARKGFGSRLIEQRLAHELGGDTRLQFLQGGVHCTINFPVMLVEENTQ